MTISVKIGSEADATPLQVCCQNDLVVVLLSNNSIMAYNKQKLALQYKVVVPSCNSICINNGKVFAVCSDGLIFEVVEGKPRSICNLKNNLSCCVASENILYVGCIDIPHDGSLIYVIDLTTLNTKKIEFSHFGDITCLKLYNETLYSAGVDGLVCEYDADLEVGRVFNGEASVCDFVVSESSAVILTDIHTVVSVDCDNGKSVKYGRPSDELFGVCCLETRKGVKVLFTNADGALSSFKPSSRNLKADGNSSVHSSFVECATMADSVDVITIDDQMNMKMAPYRQLFEKQKSAPMDE